MSSLAHDGCPESRDGTHSCFFPEKKASLLMVKSVPLIWIEIEINTTLYLYPRRELHCWWWYLWYSVSVLISVKYGQMSVLIHLVCRYFGVRKLRHIFYEKCVPIKKHIFNLLVETSPSSSDQDLLMSSQQLRSHADKIHQFSQWTNVSVKPTGWITTIFHLPSSREGKRMCWDKVKR